MIPHGGGLNLVEEVKTINSTTPVIIITGMSIDLLESTQIKADEIIPKPFSTSELLEAVNELTQDNLRPE